MYISGVMYTYIFADFTATFSLKNEILLIAKRLVTFITGETCGMVMLTIYYICLILYIWSTRSTASCKNQYEIIVLLLKYFILMFYHVFNEAWNNFNLPNIVSGSYEGITSLFWNALTRFCVSSSTKSNPDFSPASSFFAGSFIF